MGGNEAEERREARELVEKALAQMEPKFRSVIVLRMLEGYSTKETAAILEVPLGTVIKDSETGEPIVEIIDDGQEEIVYRGGRGGQGNQHFKTATNQAPYFAQEGEAGKDGWVVMELKVLADVGLVGFPNAGKSTFLSAVSEAKPEIADYPFTTLTPNLGVVSYRDNKSFVVADIPGIIEGAAEDKTIRKKYLDRANKGVERLTAIVKDLDLITKLETNELKINIYTLKRLVFHTQNYFDVTSGYISTNRKLFKEISEEICSYLLSFVNPKSHKHIKKSGKLSEIKIDKDIYEEINAQFEDKADSKVSDLLRFALAVKVLHPDIYKRLDNTTLENAEFEDSDFED